MVTARAAGSGRAWLAAAVLLCAAPAWALINPNFTPVDLFQLSQVVLRVELSPPAADGTLGVKVVRAIKGTAPDPLVLVIDPADKTVAEALAKALGGRPARGLLFTGDFAAASTTGTVEGDVKPVGVLEVGTTWFALLPRDGKLELASDPLNIKAVWAGSDVMLERVLDYIQADPRASVPVAAGVTWGAAAKVADVAGAVASCQNVEPFGDGRTALMVLCDAGDRLFMAGPDGKLTDVTAQVNLKTASRHAAWADLDGDGRLDVASAGPALLCVQRGVAGGKLADEMYAMDLREGPRSLSPIGAVQAGRQAVVLGAWPPLVATLEGGKLEMRPLPDAPADAAGPGVGGACVAADVNSDGRVDLWQAADKGVWFYKGVDGGRFAPPVPASDVPIGTGLTSLNVGDFDADGLLDLVATGKDGVALLGNAGEGRLVNTFDESGEITYIAKPDIRQGVVCDLNNDGREDLVLFYEAMGPNTFFNRGFRTFGHAINLELGSSAWPVSKPAQGGQQGGAAVDFNGDGALEVAFVTRDGGLWVLTRGPEGSRLAAVVSPPAGQSGPLTVVGSDGPRALGARSTVAGRPALFAKPTKGPLKLEWRRGDGAAASQTSVVLQAVRVDLKADSK